MPNTPDWIQVIEFLMLLGTTISTVISMVFNSRMRVQLVRMKEEILEAVRKEFLTVSYKETFELKMASQMDRLVSIEKIVDDIKTEGCRKFQRHINSRLPYAETD